MTCLMNKTVPITVRLTIKTTLVITGPSLMFKYLNGGTVRLPDVSGFMANTLSHTLICTPVRNVYTQYHLVMFSEYYVHYPLEYDIGDKAVCQFKWNSLVTNYGYYFVNHWRPRISRTSRKIHCGETGSPYFIWLCVNMNTMNDSFIKSVT